MSKRILLFIFCLYFVPCTKANNGQLSFRKTKVGFSIGELCQLSDLKYLRLVINNQINHLWHWSSVWNKDYAYGVPYLLNNKTVLLKSKDGIYDDEIIQFGLFMSTNGAGVSFKPGEDMIIVFRDRNSSGFIGEQSHPYTNWKWKESNISDLCPTLIDIKNNIFLL